MLKKVLLGIVNTISIIVICAAVLVLIAVLMTSPGKTPNIAGFMALRVTTGSMAPTYKTDTLIIVKETSPGLIKEGDVISFYSSDPALDGAVNTHRVVSITKVSDGYTFVTKGDANNVVDQYDVHSKYLLGKVVASSLFVGKLVRLVSNPLVFIPMILIPLVIILVSNLVHMVRCAKDIAREEEEAAVREALDIINSKKKQ